LAEITTMLKDPNLTPENRAELEKHAASLSGTLMHSWLPVGIGRRLIMLALLLSGCFGLVVGEPMWLLAWGFLIIFSPRAIGELSYFVGKIASMVSGGR